MPLRTFVKRCLFALLRTGFRLTPISASTRVRLRQRFLDQHAHLLPQEPRAELDDTSREQTSHEQSSQEERPQTERSARTGAIVRAIGYLPLKRGTLPSPLPATLVAFYRPQFHQTPQDDSCWGEVFNEWQKVASALPQFEGHAQPRLPGDLGCYDLRGPEILHRQMQLARNYGISAFCIHFYWFAGKSSLEASLQQWMADPTLDLPLCCCWANEDSAHRSDSSAGEVLIDRQHSPADDVAFIEHVSRYIADPRYLRVDGKPLLVVCRPDQLPDAKATASRWREWCHANGVGEILLLYVQGCDIVDPQTIGFDAAIEYPPNNATLAPITASQHLLNPDYSGNIFDWRELTRQCMAQPDRGYPLYPGVNPAWDDAPRHSGSGNTFIHASPRGYRDWLRHAIGAAQERFPTRPLVFINAWNKWAEGAVLEPDTRLGYAWLEATRAALKPVPIENGRPCAVLHIWYPELLDELVEALRASGIDWRIVITTAHEREQQVRQRTERLGVDAEIEVFENRGRDILPFLHVANRLLDEGVTTVLKLHGKRSTHREDGEAWRRELLDKLVAPERAQRIVTAFREDYTLGLVHAEGHLLPLDFYWGANRANVDYLTRRLGIPAPRVEHDSFVAGSMFWLRPAALRLLLDAHLDAQDFDSEAGQLDGTMAHAIERVFVLAANAGGFVTASATGLHETAAGTYPYAQRSD